MAKPDWEAIESAYRAGVLSLRDIGEKYGVTEGGYQEEGQKAWLGTQWRYAGLQKWYAKKKSAYQQKACHYWPYTKRYATKNRTYTGYETDTRNAYRSPD